GTLPERSRGRSGGRGGEGRVGLHRAARAEPHRGELAHRRGHESSPACWKRGSLAMSLFGTRQRARVLALAHHTGGGGKTTPAINLGTALAAVGERVLIIDLDPQGNASTGLGVDQRPISTFDVLSGHATIMQAMVPTPNVPRLSIVPATIDLMSFEREAGTAGGRHYPLRARLAAMHAAT